nr:MAG TPA: hypothetical protein [Caudoviricetes sp.]
MGIYKFNQHKQCNQNNYFHIHSPFNSSCFIIICILIRIILNKIIDIWIVYSDHIR